MDGRGYRPSRYREKALRRCYSRMPLDAEGSGTWIRRMEAAIERRVEKQVDSLEARIGRVGERSVGAERELAVVRGRDQLRAHGDARSTGADVMIVAENAGRRRLDGLIGEAIVNVRRDRRHAQRRPQHGVRTESLRVPGRPFGLDDVGRVVAQARLGRPRIDDVVNTPTVGEVGAIDRGAVGPRAPTEAGAVPPLDAVLPSVGDAEEVEFAEVERNAVARVLHEVVHLRLE